MVRSDCGTENTEVASCHMALRHGHSDVFAGCNSYRFGTSTTNTVSVCTLVKFTAYLANQALMLQLCT